MQLTQREYTVLRWAVNEAASWRGALVGNPDTRALEEHDATIRFAKEVLKKYKPAAKPKGATRKEKK